MPVQYILCVLVIKDFNNLVLICWGRSKAKRTITFPLSYTNKPIVNVGDEHGGDAHFSAINTTETDFYLKAYTVNTEYDDNGNWIVIGF